jgi:hypothetical protein
LVIPAEVTVVSTQRGADDPRTRIQTARTLMKLSLLLPIGFLFLLTLLTLINSSLKSWLAWWGIPLFSTGLIAMLAGIIGAPLIGFILKQVIEMQTRIPLPISLSNYASGLTSAILGAIMLPIFWEGLGLLMIGTGMTVISFFIKPKKIPGHS